MCSKAVAGVLFLLTSSTAMPPPPSTHSEADDDFPQVTSSSFLIGSTEDHPHPPLPPPALSNANGDILPLASPPPQHSHSTLHPLIEPFPGKEMLQSPDNTESVNTVISPPTLQFLPAVPLPDGENRHPSSVPQVPNADFLSSFLNLVEPPVVSNEVFNGDPSDASRTLGETLKGLLESNLVPIPQMEPRSDPVTFASTIWAAVIGIVTFILRKKMMFFAALGAIVATIVGVTFGTSSLFRQGKSAEDRHDTLELMLSHEGLAGLISNIQALWARLLQLLATPVEVLLAGGQVADGAQDRSDSNVSATTPKLNSSFPTTIGPEPNDTSTTRPTGIVLSTTTSLPLSTTPTTRDASTTKAPAVLSTTTALSEILSTTAEIPQTETLSTTAVPSILSTSEAPVPLSSSKPVDTEVDLIPGGVAEAVLQAALQHVDQDIPSADFTAIETSSETPSTAKADFSASANPAPSIGGVFVETLGNLFGKNAED